jgi:hypothetical protein
LGWEAYIDQCGNRWGVVLNFCIVSHIVAITSRLVLLILIAPGKVSLKEYSRLPVSLTGKGEEVRFG